MEKHVTLFALLNFEYSRQKEILFYTEWDDAISDADYHEPTDKPDFNYSTIIEFELDEAVLEDIRMTDTESLTDLLNAQTTTKKHYFN
ncbi:hypothetical protein AMR72_00645 [Flavobacterium psychrophilum]|nr:hypothetical protein AMR72_00645 [Flavobacterium psychrophilum]AOE51157.1 hypothetical protein ALW18_00645 [Flavobacterium psychrophilum]